MRPERIAAILEALTTHFTFAPGFAHAIELDPRSVTPDLATRLVALGVNRVSPGVRDLDPDVQLAIGRVQPFGVVAAAFDALRGAGIAQINVDLIYGLPLQTTVSVAATARQVCSLGADRVACCGYAHLPRRKRNQRLIDAAALPDSTERLAQAQSIAAVFLAEGFERIGIDHFARPDDVLAAAARGGRLHRNFQGYTDEEGEVLLGFGASAISRLEAGFVQNVADPRAYSLAVEHGHLPTGRGYRLTGDDRIRAAVIDGLMCTFAVDLARFGGKTAFADELALLRPLMADGLATLTDGVIAMTLLGRPFVRVVASIFDTFPQGASSGFSVAV